MKTILTLLISLFSYSIIIAQTGISVQGIARDDQKAALVDETLTFTFEIQEDVGGASHYKESVSIKTDPYGVFSHIISTGTVISGTFIDIPFRQKQMKLIISVVYNGNNIVVSNAPFQYAPYAISAENGVPTGTIVAFAGVAANVPTGWVLCDGQDLTIITGANNLIAIVGNNAPDLQGMFLRGTGSAGAGQDGPALREVQQDGFENHTIAGTAATAGNHNHSFKVDKGGGGNHGGGNMITASDFGNFTANHLQYTASNGNHTHSVSGNADGGTTETRPVNYGVNYIIKL